MLEPPRNLLARICWAQAKLSSPTAGLAYTLDLQQKFASRSDFVVCRTVERTERRAQRVQNSV